VCGCYICVNFAKVLGNSGIIPIFGHHHTERTMNQKLQELTDRIYAEGVEQANQEAERIREEAQKAATAMLEKAKREAEATRKEAERAAEALRRKTEAEMQASTRQALNSLKQQLTELVSTRLVDEPLQKALSGEDFRKQLLLKTLEGWNPANDGALRLQLPAEESLRQALEAELGKLLGNGLELQLREDLPPGAFRVQPAEGQYFVEFSEEAFQTFFRLHARPLIVNLLFGSSNG
jgi:V/A-type H+-transporting ATPase subunit E